MSASELQILVTGSQGFLGRHLTSYLQEKGVSVRQAARHFDAVESAQFAYGNLEGFEDWPALFANIDVVVHLVAKVHDMSPGQTYDSYLNTNTHLTKKVAIEAKKNGVKRFVYISTIKVNGEWTAAEPFRADDLPAPSDFYSQSKYEAEKEILKLHETGKFEIVIIRPPLIYGVGVKANFQNLVRIVKKGWPLPFGRIQNSRSLIYVKNLCHLIHVCTQKPQASGQIFLASDGQDLSLTELIHCISQGLGRTIWLVPVPQYFLEFILRILGRGHIATRLFSNLQVDITKTKQLLDWTPPYSVETGFSETLDSDHQR